MAGRSTRVRLVVAVLAALAILAPLAWLWQSSLVAKSYSVMGMGYLDYGGGPAAVMIMVRRLARFPTSSWTIRARPTCVLILSRNSRTSTSAVAVCPATPSTAPHPARRSRHNRASSSRCTCATPLSKAGIALHWHGVDVPAAMDGVAGVTQDEVPVGGEFTYRFVAHQIGTYWYHSHQLSDEQVVGGLFGALVVLPKKGRTEPVDVVAAAHSYAGTKTINGATGDLRVPASPGQQVRVRVINTDNGAIESWADTPFRLLAIDAYAVNGPTGGYRSDDRSPQAAELILASRCRAMASRYECRCRKGRPSFWAPAIQHLRRNPQPSSIS